jgi:hypothetical protein
LEKRKRIGFYIAEKILMEIIEKVVIYLGLKIIV